ncbi:hypothetical protein LCGC14_2473830 [marine sediment metagenome]|uniref:Uncharacterized protein n=1 Tax=marine sediment metagenome TaxID=412755 RepID=A0A0F9B9H3_9ZZZZ
MNQAEMDTLGEIREKLGAVDERTKATHAIVEKSEKHLGKLNDRTRSLESWRSWITGGGATALGLLGALSLPPVREAIANALGS